MYESIIVSAYYFAEGGFWVVNIAGYITDDGPDDPESIEADPTTLDNDENDHDGVVEQLEMLAELHTSEAGRVSIEVNGNHVKCVG